MARRWWLTLLLLVIVAGLAAVAWLDPGGTDRTPRLTGLQAEDVGHLRIQRRSREPLELRRSTDGWALLAPAQLPASAFHVEQVLALLERPVEASYKLAELDREEIGLEPPRVRISVDGEELLFGVSHPMGNRRYVQYRDRIHMVQEGVMPLLEGPWWNFIDRHLVFPGRQVQEVLTPAYHLQRQDDNWVLLAGEPPDGVTAEQLAQAWNHASALVVRPVRRERVDETPVQLSWTDGEGRLLRPEQVDGEFRLVDPQRGLAYALSEHVQDFLLRGVLPQDEVRD